MNRTFEKCAILDTLIFPNQQILINDIYQPLTLIDNTSSGLSEKIKIDKYPSALFDKYQKVLICDNAGMGKSTLSRFICTQTIKEKLGIPVFIELRKINSNNNIINELLNQLNPIEQNIDKQLVFHLLNEGEFVIVFDGFDEISDENKEVVTRDIKDFTLKCNKNYYLLTSRPENAITTFGDFKLTNICNLKNNEAFELLNKFDSISKSKISAKLINEIKGINNQVHEFLSNPFLVSLLYKTYSFKRDIPSRKSTFYNEVYSALFQDHALSKDSYKRDKNSKLDIHDFRVILREFANYTVKKGEVEYSVIKASSYLSECKKRVPSIDFKEFDYISDLLTTVPIFTKEGSVIKWAHKSLQDYFTAEYITYHPKKAQIINYLIKKDIKKYQNIIELLIELDPNLIRHYVIPDILEDLINHFNNNNNIDLISPGVLAVRKMATFESIFWINKLPNEHRTAATSSKEFTRVRLIIKNEFECSFNGATIFDDKYIVTYNTSNKALFVQMLGKKGFLGKSIYRKHSSSMLPEDIFSEQPTLVNETNSIFNSKENFKQVNKIITDTFKIGNKRDYFSFVPDIEYCKELLQTIKGEIKLNDDDEHLAGY